MRSASEEHTHGQSSLSLTKTSPFAASQMHLLREPRRGTWVLPLEGGHAQVLADLLLQHAVLPRLIGRPFVLDQVFCWVVAKARHRYTLCLHVASIQCYF